MIKVSNPKKTKFDLIIFYICFLIIKRVIILKISTDKYRNNVVELFECLHNETVVDIFTFHQPKSICMFVCAYIYIYILFYNLLRIIENMENSHNYKQEWQMYTF